MSILGCLNARHIWICSWAKPSVPCSKEFRLQSCSCSLAKPARCCASLLSKPSTPPCSKLDRSSPPMSGRMIWHSVTKLQQLHWFWEKREKQRPCLPWKSCANFSLTSKCLAKKNHYPSTAESPKLSFASRLTQWTSSPK